MSETGVVKFRCERLPLSLAEFPGFAELHACRRKLRALGCIGVDANGIGYGNLSMRARLTSAFYITGSGSSALSDLTPADCAKVIAYDFAANCVRCEGAVASSESLTHAAIYQADADARAVIHCHAAELWARALDDAPTTSREVDYGTPAMADEVLRLFAMTNVKEKRFFVMAGHAGGVMAFGASMDEAFAALTRR